MPSSEDVPDKIMSAKPCPTCVDCNELVPLVKQNAPRQARTINLAIDFFADSEGVIRAHWNNISCEFPENTCYLNLVRAKEDFPKYCLHKNVNYGEVIRLVINNHDSGEHPIHFHGYKFWVLYEARPGAGNYNSDDDEKHLKFNNPLMRDTASVNPESHLVLEFIADNPGVWLLHCHINWHMNIGLSVVFNIAPEKTVEIFGETEHLQQCAAGADEI